MSKTLDKMLTDKKGYRTESFGGSGWRDLREVLAFEIGELGNVDPLDYPKERYGILADFQLSDDTFAELRKAAADEKELQRLINEEEQNLAVANIMHYVDQVVAYVKNHFGTDDLIAIWLTEYDQVTFLYDGVPGEIDEYVIPDNHLVITDIEIDGALFVIKKEDMEVSYGH